MQTDIAASNRSFGPPTAMRSPGPQFGLMQPGEVGEQVVDAILADRFMLPTHAEVGALLIARATDWDGFIQQQIDHPTIVTLPAR